MLVKLYGLQVAKSQITRTIFETKYHFHITHLYKKNKINVVNIYKKSWWTLISFTFWILNQIKNNFWDLATFTSIKMEWETLLSFTFRRLDQIENTFWKLATFTSIKIEWDPELARSSSASLSLNKKMTRMVHQSEPIHFLSFPSFLLCFCDYRKFLCWYT